MIDDIRTHLRDDHAYDESELTLAVRATDEELWKLHAHFHGEKLSTTQARRLLSGK